MAGTAPNRLALVSLDGLSLEDFSRLTELLPRSARHLAGGSATRLNAGLLTSAAAIWGEVLTGAPWYENGCDGHARPWNTLNRTQVMTERDLKLPARLLNGESQFVINVPLLVPQEPKRFWLSDGSLPLPMTVSPQWLMAEEPFYSYNPRPYTALADGIGYHEGAIQGCLQNEEHRMECARELLRTNAPNISIIRLSLFDHLSHLLGVGYLADEELVYGEEIRRFLGVLDAWLCDLFSEVAHVVLISAFSHVPCESRMSLNALLERRGFLTYGGADAASGRRVAALVAIADDEGDEGQEGRAASYAHARFQQAVFDSSRTLAASPVLGCVYVNAKERFEDGIVEGADVAETREVVRECFEDLLGGSFGSRYSIWSADELDRSVSDRQCALLPDLLVHVLGAELHNNTDAFFGPSDRPRSVHSPEGFLWSQSKNLPTMIRTTEVCSLLKRA